MPGTGFSYSNIGAALVGLLVQEISGQPFNEYCNEHIFEVLSMENTHWFLSEIDDLTYVALPYNSEGGGAYIDDCSGDGDCCLESWIGDGFSDCEDQAWDCDLSCYDNDGGDCGENSGSAYCGDGLCSTNEDFDSCPEDCPENQCGNGNLAAYEHYGYSDYPSGQLRTTSNSLAKFMGAYINSGSFNGSRILQPETVEMIKEISSPSTAPDQGLMWYYKNSEGRSLLGHNGGDMGVSTEMFISSSSDVGVIVLSNSASYNAVIQIENAVFDFAEATDFTLTGDINADSTVNIQDIVLAVNFILENEYSASADLNSDNNVDVLDIVQIVSIILN